MNLPAAGNCSWWWITSHQLNDIMHKCSKCGHVYELQELPSKNEIFLEGKRKYIPFGEHVFVTYPSCGKRDWADE